MKKSVKQLIDELPDAERALMQRRVNGESLWDIAKELEIPVDYLKTLARQAHSSLRNAMEREGILKPKKLGFTMVEMMTVIAIVGVMAAMAIPFGLKVKANAIERKQKAAASILRRAAGTYAVHVQAHCDSTNYITIENVDPWIRGGFDALTVEGQVPKMPKLRGNDYIYGDSEEIADMMFD